MVLFNKFSAHSKTQLKRNCPCSNANYAMLIGRREKMNKILIDAKMVIDIYVN